MTLAKTISPDGISARALLALTVTLILGGCEVYATAPPCPFASSDAVAPSAGCFSLEDGKLLVVQNGKDLLSPPGGNALDGETSQCTAYRETWEETGLALEPVELLDVFDTGFHLYRCERFEDSGVVDPPERFEVRAAFYLAPDEFEQWEWRFHGQQQVLKALIDRVSGKTPPGSAESGSPPTPPGKR